MVVGAASPEWPAHARRLGIAAGRDRLDLRHLLGRTLVALVGCVVAPGFDFTDFELGPGEG